MKQNLHCLAKAFLQTRFVGLWDFCNSVFPYKCDTTTVAYLSCELKQEASKQQIITLSPQEDRRISQVKNDCNFTFFSSPFCLLSVPSKAPKILSTQFESSTSIEVNWEQLTDEFWRGVPFIYTVFYVLEDAYRVSGTTKNVSGINATYPATSVQLTQLEKYKEYVIWMSATTVKGAGWNSTVAMQKTDQDSKTLHIFCY